MILKRPAQGGREGIDSAAFETARSDDRLSAAGRCAATHGDALQGCTSVAFDERAAPANGNAAVGRLQRHDLDAFCSEQSRPMPVRAETRPTRTAECEDYRLGADLHAFAVGV